MPVRPAICAQQGWYPATRPRLLETLKVLVPEREDAAPAVAVVAPHAGFDYSGGVAGQVYSRVVVPNDVLLLGVNHRNPRAAQFALFDEGAWETPLGDVPIATELVAAIAADCPMVEADPDAHADENSGELHVPFLKYRNPHVKIAPITIRGGSLAELRELGTALARAAERVGRPVLLVASTDMTHYEPHHVAVEKDHLVIDRILQLDEEAMLATVQRHDISMCGHDPVAAGLVYAKARGATTAELVDYKTSGDAPGGRRDHVVGYAGLIIR